MRRLILAAVTAFVAVCAKHVRADIKWDGWVLVAESIPNEWRLKSVSQTEVLLVYRGRSSIVDIPGTFVVEYERSGYNEKTGEETFEKKTENFRVIGLGDYAFSGNEVITAVTIPSGVTSIGYQAFCGCRSLSSVTIPSSVTSIGNWAFSGCSSLSSVTIPSGVTSIGYQAFYDCRSLSSVVIPSGVTSIGDYAFYDCRSLSSVVIPSGVTSIGNWAFSGCSSLPSVTIPSSVVDISSGAFSDCSSLPSVTIPSNVVHIGSAAFSGCRSLSSVAIPSGVTNIGSRAFYANSSLGSVDIGTGVKTVGAECFCSCMNLTNVIFRGDAPTTVGGLVFSETSLDLNVVVPRLRSGWTGPDGGLPARWPYNTETGRYIRYVDEPVISSERIVEVQLSVTNIVVNYILNSVQPELAVPISPDTGFVTVVTEVKGNTKGVVAVPDSWSASFPNFHKRFGGNFAEAVTRQTGKRDAVGNPMQVWQDFVAGTDPTDEKDVFTASVTMVDGKPVVSWTPELRPKEAAKRKYTTYGKVRLQDKQWVEVPVGHEKDYNFFKVSVEMR